MRVQRKRKKSLWERLKTKLSKIGTLNIILMLVGVFFVWFNYRMLEMYLLMGSIPETYACAVIAATIGECGICGWIRTNKDKRQERQWTKEDQEEIDQNSEEGGKG